MLQKEPQQKNLVVIIALVTKINRPILGQDAITKLLFLAQKGNLPVEYPFRVLNGFPLSDEVFSDLKTLVRTGALQEEFKDVDGLRVAEYTPAFKPDEMDEYFHSSLTPEELHQVDQFVNSIRGKISQELLAKEVRRTIGEQ